MYLTELHPEARLDAPVGSPQRADYLRWLAFWASEADPVYNARMFYKDRLDWMTIRDSERVTTRVAQALSHAPFLLGERFTIADLLLSGPLEWDPGLAGEDPKIADWLKRLAERPAAIRAIALDAASSQ